MLTTRIDNSGKIRNRYSMLLAIFILSGQQLANQPATVHTRNRWQIFMKQKSLLLYLILIFCLFSCDSNKKHYKKKKNIKENKFIEIFGDTSKIDTTKDYQKQSMIFKYPNQIEEHIEIYINKKNDTFYNEFKFYKRNKIDSLKSKFYILEIEGLKKDSLLDGKISFFSPADSIPKRKMESRHVTFIYLQRENDEDLPVFGQL